MTNVVEFKAQDLTPSERVQAERLVWTEDMGRGWRKPTINSDDLPFLQGIEAKLEARQAPLNRVVIIGHLARLANHFRQDRPADAWQMLFEDYAEDLHGISEAHLREIISKYRGEKPFFPKIAELVEMWDALRYREAEQLRRARVILGLEPAKAWEVA